MKVFLPKPAVGNVGEYRHILKGGVQLSDRLTEVPHLNGADVVVLDVHRLSRAEVQFFVTEGSSKGARVIAIDYSDDPNELKHLDVPGIDRFKKRSTVLRQNGQSVAIVPVAEEVEFLPYCIREDIRSLFDSLDAQVRDIDVSCFLAPWETRFGVIQRGKIARKVVTGLPDRFEQRVGLVGSSGKVGRNAVNEAYVRTMARSRVVVTCQPDRWEGDYRTFEALACGPLVMSDRMLRPPEGLVDGEHIVFYDGPGDMLSKLKFYLDHEEQRSAIARSGFDHARAHHRAHHRMEYACRL
jgi:hypothetical protein